MCSCVWSECVDEWVFLVNSKGMCTAHFGCYLLCISNFHLLFSRVAMTITYCHKKGSWQNQDHTAVNTMFTSSRFTIMVILKSACPISAVIAPVYQSSCVWYARFFFFLSRWWACKSGLCIVFQQVQYSVFLLAVSNVENNAQRNALQICIRG